MGEIPEEYHLLTSIAAAAVILALLIIVHEAGHFAMAKRLGVRVLRFSIGYPPKVWGVRRGETEYAIGATPFGGYVRMLGEEVGEEPRSEELENYVRELALDVLQSAEENGWTSEGKIDDRLVTLARQMMLAAEPRHQALGGEFPGAPAVPTPSETPQAHLAAMRKIAGRALLPEETEVMEEIAREGSVAQAQKSVAARNYGAVFASFRKRAFPTQSLWKRFVIVLAGPASNIVFAPILMTIVYMWGVPTFLPVVGELQKGMPAAEAGLKAGDHIVAVNGNPTATWSDFSAAVRSSDGHSLRLQIERDGALTELVITPKREDEPTVYGNKVAIWIIGVSPRGDSKTESYGPIDAVEKGTMATVNMAAMLGYGIWQIIDGSTPVRQALGGPIMIAQMAGKEAREGFSSLMMFTVMLSLELGIINLLPVPLLDGGHLLFFVCEGVRGKPLQLRTRETALQVGLFLLVALMAFVIFNDISRIVQG